MTRDPLIAGIELGGTKCVCVLGYGANDVFERVQLSTTGPEETLGKIEHILDGWKSFAAIGIASFGPIAIDRAATGYGCITSTPKPGWANTDVAMRFAARYAVPIGFHTDVVAAALAEAAWGSGLETMAYVTVGTGVGVGLIADGSPIEGLTHPELGHVRPARAAGDHWPGACRFHGDCIEGLSSGPAIAARAGKGAALLAADDPVWDYVAHALGQLCATLALTGVPRRIVMGGGVMIGAKHLFGRVRDEFRRSLANYIVLRELANPEHYIVPAALGADAGPLGALLLGRQALAGATMA